MGSGGGGQVKICILKSAFLRFFYIYSQLCLCSQIDLKTKATLNIESYIDGFRVIFYEKYKYI